MVFVETARRTGREGRLRSSATNDLRSASCCAIDQPTWRRCSVYCSCGATVVVINPARGDERINADVDQLELPLIIGEPDDLAMLGDRRPPRWSRSRIWQSEPNVTAAGQDRTVTMPARGCGADVDQRNDRTAQTSGPHLRHAGAQRDGPGGRSAAGTHGGASRCGDRQLAAGAYRRCLPDPAMRRRGAALRVAGAIRARPLG